MNIACIKPLFFVNEMLCLMLTQLKQSSWCACRIPFQPYYTALVWNPTGLFMLEVIFN